MAACFAKVLRRWRSERGSMTLEASLVVPWILLITLALILLGVGWTNRALTYFSAASASDRAAFAWAHAAADVRTGAYPDGAYDGLYWRLADDAMLAGLFGWNGGGETSVRIGERQDDGGSLPLAEKKLRKSAEPLPHLAPGAISYRNRLWKKELTVETAAGSIPKWWPAARVVWPDVAASALVTEPAEFIRTFDLVRRYAARFREKGQGAKAYREQAADVLAKRR